MIRAHVSPWFGFAGIMFLLALLGFYAMPNLVVGEGVSAVSQSTASFSYWSTIGLTITGIVFLALGFHDLTSFHSKP